MTKNRDVAWGFFRTGLDGTRRLIVHEKRSNALLVRSVWRNANPGPIFRIVPPKKKKGKK